MKVRFTRQANLHLGAILDYARERNPRFADQLAVRIDHACAQIVDHPKLGRKQDVEGVRRKIVQPGGYFIYYSVDAKEKSITILNISHPAQQRLFNDGSLMQRSPEGWKTFERSRFNIFGYARVQTPH